MADEAQVQEGRTETEGAARRGPIVVGVGASAGGLKALQQFVEAIPPDSGMAFVVILHLDPDRESRMAELLQDRTSLPVTQLTEATPVEENHVYVVSPMLDIEMQGSTIGMRARSERSERVPVDLFFRTLVDVAGSSAIGVILSGTGSDGTEGVRAIREAGGITIAQLPEEAEYTGMPSSAIATGLIDLILPAARIPGELVRLRNEPNPLSAAADGHDVEAELTPIFAALRTRTGHDFSMYKRSTVLRRIGRRLLFNGVATLPEYLVLLRESDSEAQALRRDLLISVSAFFRDADEFDALAAAVPKLFEGKESKDTVRVWIVGCATGEEVYSIAMLLSEHAATLPDPPRIQLFATDIDEKGYAVGREGLYPAAAVARIRPDRLQRFFVKEAGGYRVAKALREIVLFAIHDVLRDPPFARMDLVSCRHLFIYLQPEAQRQVLETFHYALNPLGMLFLGAAESVGDGTLFRPVTSGAHRLFARNPVPHRVVPRVAAVDPPRWSVQGTGSAPGEGGVPFSYGALHTSLLESYGPPSVVVNERWEVVHVSSSAGRFLRVAGGEPSHRLLDLVRPDLRSALRTSVHQAFELGQPMSRVVRVHEDGGDQEIKVEARPSVGRATGGTRFALITFEESEVKPEASVPRQVTNPEDVAELEDQLGQMREQLELARTDHDHSVAELQTANEELLSINEEQKAAVEELETGREEIQAINEELTTINQEHQSTIEELKRTNADVQNLIESTEIGTIFVDRELRIRRFTPPVTGVFNFAPSDVGRPLRDITHRLDYADLIVDVTEVLGSLERREREVGSSGNEWFIVRINPYRSHEGNADGAVLTFFNHTARHRLEEELREATIVAEAGNRAKDRFLSTLSHELRTPLSAIMGYADILGLNDPLSPEQAQRVERIKEGGRHLDSMIGQLLDFSRLDTNRVTIERQAFDACAILNDVHLLMRPLAEKKHLTWSMDLPPGPIPVTTDGDKARQVLANLCGNAIKYTTTGGVRLGVREAHDRVVYEVSDTGPGIAPEHHARIFERFWQVDGGSTRLDSGLGIGLAAAREYGRLLGGDVEVESRLGEGSTFRFWLPQPNYYLVAGQTEALPVLAAAENEPQVRVLER